MGLLQAAYRTYEHYSHLAGVLVANQETMAPISHMVQNAQIEISITDKGLFSGARSVPKKENKTIIPVTMESAGRTGNNERAHPLCDQLRYLAFYGGKKYEAYHANLKRWAESEYTHPKVEAVLRYIQGGTILEDLQSAGLITLKKDGTPDSGKIESTEYDKCLVRWRILPQTDSTPSACWEDTTLFEAFTPFYAKQRVNLSQDFCMISGARDVPASSHPKGVVPASFGAKLISANDNSGCTYRGRFFTASEAGSVGYTASQKAHTTLRWLTANHGTVMGERTFLWWNPNGKALPNFSDLGFEIPNNKDEDDSAFVSHRKQLRDTLRSYRNSLTPEDDVVVAALEAATTGRLSVTYYSELRAQDLLDRIDHWYSTCYWGPSEEMSWPPSLHHIVLCAWGTERDKSLEVDEKVLREHVQQLLHCVINHRPMPVNIVRALFIRANQPLAYNEKNRKYVLSTACAVIRKYRNEVYKEAWTLALDERNQDRSYLFGRLLAVADHVERKAHRERHDDEKKDTNALRMQAMFSQRPFDTWRRLEEKLSPYYARLSPGLQHYFRKITQSIIDLMDASDPDLNKALADSYLLGYYHQRSKLTTMNENKNNDVEVSHDELGE